MGIGAADDDERPAALETSVFEFNNRPRRDIVFTVLYLVGLALAVLIGLSGIGTSNPSGFSTYLDDTKDECPLPPTSSGRHLHQSTAAGYADYTPATVLSVPSSEPPLAAIAANYAFLITLGLVGSVGLGLLFFILCKKQAKRLVKITIVIMLASLWLTAIGVTLVGQLALAVFYLVFALTVTAFMYYVRNRLPLVVDLVSLAGHSVTENHSIFKVSLFMELVVATVVDILFLVLMFFALTNGSVSYNPNRLTHHNETQVPETQVWGKAIRMAMGAHHHMQQAAQMSASQVQLGLAGLSAAELQATLPGLVANASCFTASGTPSPCLDDVCYDLSNYQVACCSWTPAPWTLPYLGFAAAVLFFSMFLIMQVKVFAVAGAISQWYFGAGSPPVQIASLFPQDYPPTQGVPGLQIVSHSTPGDAMLSLKHAFGPSFGTLCMGSVAMVFSMGVQKGVQGPMGAPIGALRAAVATVVNVGTYAFDMLTRFGTIWAAISGEAFLPSWRGVISVLKLDLVGTAVVWYLPGAILNTSVILLSITWGLTFTLIASCSHSYILGLNTLAALISGGMLGLAVGLLAWAIMTFFSSLVLYAADTLYLCFMIDRHRSSSSSAPHVFSKLPSAAVEEGGAVTPGRTSSDGETEPADEASPLLRPLPTAEAAAHC